MNGKRIAMHVHAIYRRCGHTAAEVHTRLTRRRGVNNGGPEIVK